MAAEMTSNEERTWGMICHLAGLAVLTHIPFAGIIAPLIVWLIKKDRYPFVDDQGKESLNFQMTVALLMAAGVALAFLGVITIIGMGMACVLGPALYGLMIADIVLVVIAGVNANKGQRYRYPWTIRFLK